FDVGILSMAKGDVTCDQRNEIRVFVNSGILHIYDQDSKVWLTAFSTTSTLTGEYSDMVVADLDGSGKHEIIVSSAADMAVFLSEQLSWTVPGAGGSLAVGQMDGDPTLEIATGNGKVVDSLTKTIQWNRDQAFGY